MRRVITAKSYLTVLSLFSLTLFALVGANLMLRGEQIQEAVTEEKELAAKAEIERAVKTVYAEINRILVDLGQWDEIHQQLGDPTYYVYWREMRLKRSQRFPAFVQGLELYNEERSALVSLPYQFFPVKLPEAVRVLRRHEGRDYLMAYGPIHVRSGGQKVQGYIGLQIDVIEAMQRLNRFVHIKPGSLRIQAGEGMAVSAIAMASLMRYDLIDAPGSNRFAELLKDSLHDFFLLFAFMVVVFYLTVSFLFVRPLGGLERYLGRLRRGEQREGEEVFDSVVPVVAELRTVRDSLNDYQHELEQAQKRLDAQNVDLWKLAHRDALTGVRNRLAFDEDWAELIQLAKDKRIDISLLLLDCDFFKAINDTYGHEMGDRVIQSIAEGLLGVLREGEKLYRLGGDEFVTILINAGRDEAHQVALRCLESVQRHAFERLGIKETVKLSAGLAHASGTDIANLSELPRQADVAMYHAKGSTRDKIVHYSQNLEQHASSLVSNRIVGAVLRALESGEGIVMHYQPLVESKGHRPAYYEALVRIVDEGGVISPADIFPVVARRRLEVELDKAVLRAVEKDLASGRIPSGVGLTINVSGPLIALQDFCEHFLDLVPFLTAHPIAIEVTETSFISHLQHASECLRKLREKGFLIALDDFGSGYSSIRYLANMPVDIVKFDIAMVQDLNKDSRTRIIIKQTARLINEAGYMLVAEGIEDAETLQRVEALNAVYLQGFLFGRPEPLEHLFP